jgi:catechol 2,3-dioxygenase-like lactoylglutathione lyase family enzyme
MKPHGTFVWNELASSDPADAQAFYGAVLGWEFEAFDLPGGAYWVTRSGPGRLEEPGRDRVEPTRLGNSRHQRLGTTFIIHARGEPFRPAGLKPRIVRPRHLQDSGQVPHRRSPGEMAVGRELSGSFADSVDRKAIDLSMTWWELMSDGVIMSPTHELWRSLT